MLRTACPITGRLKHQLAALSANSMHCNRRRLLWSPAAEGKHPQGLCIRLPEACSPACSKPASACPCLKQRTLRQSGLGFSLSVPAKGSVWSRYQSARLCERVLLAICTSPASMLDGSVSPVSPVSASRLPLHHRIVCVAVCLSASDVSLNLHRTPWSCMHNPSTCTHIPQALW